MKAKCVGVVQSCESSKLPTAQDGRSWTPSAIFGGAYSNGTKITLVCPGGTTVQPQDAYVTCTKGQYLGTGTNAKCAAGGNTPPP
eukprot:COSAG05_NODE_24342_length_252_cov_0.673203_1_plen_84_part_11